MSPFDYNEEVNWGQLVRPTAPDVNTFETFVFRILAANGDHLGWFPKPPDEAAVAFTAMGFPSATSVGADGRRATLSLRTVPNPAFATVRFRLDLPEGAHVRLDVLDVMGRRVASLEDGRLSAGTHDIAWEGRGERGEKCPPGIYFTKLQVDGRSHMQRFALLAGLQ